MQNYDLCRILIYKMVGGIFWRKIFLLNLTHRLFRRCSPAVESVRPSLILHHHRRRLRRPIMLSLQPCRCNRLSHVLPAAAALWQILPSVSVSGIVAALGISDRVFPCLVANYCCGRVFPSAALSLLSSSSAYERFEIIHVKLF